VTRFVDRGAVTAAYVGIGMAVTIGLSFLLVIPIEWVIWMLALPSGLLIGYYANQRSDRRAGPWSRILVNGLFAGVVTGLTAAAFLLAVKGLFFAADNGYGRPAACQPGADCAYHRYLDAGRGTVLAAAGITDADSFARFYWGEQLSSAGTILLLTSIGGLAGASLYGIFRPKPKPVPRETVVASPTR
jgi:hypothetical protein